MLQSLGSLFCASILQLLRLSFGKLVPFYCKKKGSCLYYPSYDYRQDDDLGFSILNGSAHHLHARVPLVLPPLPSGFPPPSPQIEFPLATVTKLYPPSIGRDGGRDGMEVVTGGAVEVSNLYIQGALFISGVDNSRGGLPHKYLVGIRFSLGDNGRLARGISLARGRGLITGITIVLPGEEPRIKQLYGPSLARRLRIHLNLSSQEIMLEYYPYEDITSNHVWVFVHHYTVDLLDLRLRHELGFIKGPAPVPPIQEEQNSSAENFIDAWLATDALNTRSSPIQRSNTTLPLLRRQSDFRPLRIILPPKPPRVPDISPQIRPSAVPQASAQALELWVGRWTTDDIRSASETSVRIVNLVSQGAMFVYSRGRHGNKNHVTGIKFPLDHAFSTNKGLYEAWQLGTIKRVAVILPKTPEIHATYSAKLVAALRTCLDFSGSKFQSVKVIYYRYNWPMPNATYAYSFITDVNEPAKKKFPQIVQDRELVPLPDLPW